MLGSVGQIQYGNYSYYNRSENRNHSGEASEQNIPTVAPEGSGEIPVGKNLPSNQSEQTKNDTSGKNKDQSGECQSCKNRTYQDGSDDPGVSFKTPTKISADQAASAVRAHENEHVIRNQAKALREDRRVVSQSVVYHTAICAECGDVYVSGGTTRTVTKANNKDPNPALKQRFEVGIEKEEKEKGSILDTVA